MATTLPKPPADYSWTEPESDWNVKAQAPFNNITQTESGHFMEMDDTPGAERIRLQHRTGTFTEIQANGQSVHKVMGDNYEIIANDNNVLIRGVCNITVEGSSVLNVKGDAYTQIDGNAYNTIKGKSVNRISGTAEIYSESSINLFAGGVLGAVNINAADGVYINSDLYVSGAINCNQSIAAVQNISAGMRLGSVLGIETLGPIFSAISVWSPLTMGIIVSDIVGPMELIRLLYDIHVHPVLGGVTGTPAPLM
jgi:hypothetical protein